jgi:hypothetical protein
LGAVTAVVGALAVPAYGQGFDIRSWFSTPSGTTGAVAQAVPPLPPAPGSPPPWSGESARPAIIDDCGGNPHR